MENLDISAESDSISGLRFAFFIILEEDDFKKISTYDPNSLFYKNHKEFFVSNHVTIYRYANKIGKAIASVRRAYMKAFGRHKGFQFQEDNFSVIEILTKEDALKKNAEIRKQKKEAQAREKKIQELQTQPGLFNEWQLQEMRKEEFLKRKKQDREGELR